MKRVPSKEESVAMAEVLKPPHYHQKTNIFKPAKKEKEKKRRTYIQFVNTEEQRGKGKRKIKSRRRKN